MSLKMPEPDAAVLERRAAIVGKFKRILDINYDDRIAVVQPGVTASI